MCWDTCTIACSVLALLKCCQFLIKVCFPASAKACPIHLLASWSLTSEAAHHIDGSIGLYVEGGNRQALIVDQFYLIRAAWHLGREGALTTMAPLYVCTHTYQQPCYLFVKRKRSPWRTPIYRLPLLMFVSFNVAQIQWFRLFCVADQLNFVSQVYWNYLLHTSSGPMIFCFRISNPYYFRNSLKYLTSYLYFFRIN